MKDKTIYVLHANNCKILANPLRFEINKSYQATDFEFIIVNILENQPFSNQYFKVYEQK